MLGIGSGAFKVMAMDGAMKMPLKPSSATSNLMMGVTAAASATVYFFNGSIRPDLAVPFSLRDLRRFNDRDSDHADLTFKAHSSDLYPDPTLLRVTDDS